MIHDILLSCINLVQKRLDANELLDSDAVSYFLHPCERETLSRIIEILHSFRHVAIFVVKYGGRQFVSRNDANSLAYDPLQYGFYLNNFANGLNTALEQYFDEIHDLEKYYLETPMRSLIKILEVVKGNEPIVTLMRKLMRGITTHKFHGSSILQYLYQHNHYGNDRLDRTMHLIISPVQTVFLTQLSDWLMYGRLNDEFGEFFIVYDEPENDVSATDSEKVTNTSTISKITKTNESLVTSCDIWQYSIKYERLPRFISSFCAAKILFVGQTVLVFKMDANKDRSPDHIWYTSPEDDLPHTEFELWGEDKEYEFLGMLQEMQHSSDLTMHEYENVINVIKNFVTRRLSQIALNDADLKHQMALIKDFFLLGRGELYWEFIRQIYKLQKENTPSVDENNLNGIESKAKQEDYDDNLSKMLYVRAFESAAHSVGAADHLEQFQLDLKTSNSATDDTVPVNADESHEFGFTQYLQLQYKFNWPLHIMFSPNVIERYNTLFRFLLLVKKLQYDLHKVWWSQTCEVKKKLQQNLNIMHFRNQLMFFMDNLQYYIQVDVLESQYSILINVMNNDADFDEIQRAHFIFQANILSLCFLITEENADKLSLTQSTWSSPNPVNATINDIFHVCEDFCNIFKAEVMPQDFAVFENLNERFGDSMVKLIKHLIGIKTAVHKAMAVTPLSQLLLRLDYNHWFSKNRKIRNESDV